MSTHLQQKLIAILIVIISFMPGLVFSGCVPAKGVFKKVHKAYEDHSSRLRGYNVLPYNLLQADQHGYVRLWYKDLPSLYEDIKKQGKITFEDGQTTNRKLRQFPAGGLLMVEVVRLNALSAHLNKFVVVVKDGGSNVFRKELTDTSPEMKVVEYKMEEIELHWNAEIVAINRPIYKKLDIFVIDLLTNSRYKFTIEPLQDRIDLVKDSLRKHSLITSSPASGSNAGSKTKIF